MASCPDLGIPGKIPVNLRLVATPPHPPPPQTRPGKESAQSRAQEPRRGSRGHRPALLHGMALSVSPEAEGPPPPSSPSHSRELAHNRGRSAVPKPSESLPRLQGKGDSVLQALPQLWGLTNTSGTTDPRWHSCRRQSETRAPTPCPTIPTRHQPGPRGHVDQRWSGLGHGQES